MIVVLTKAGVGFSGETGRSLLRDVQQGASLDVILALGAGWRGCQRERWRRLDAADVRKPSNNAVQKRSQALVKAGADVNAKGQRRLDAPDVRG